MGTVNFPFHLSDVKNLSFFLDYSFNLRYACGVVNSVIKIEDIES